MAADAAHAPDHQPKAKIFISYSRKDMAFADRLEVALKARGFEPLFDRTEIYAFEDWWERIKNLITKADTRSTEPSASNGMDRYHHSDIGGRRYLPAPVERSPDW
jgi:hypothetical protein